MNALSHAVIPVVCLAVLALSGCVRNPFTATSEPAAQGSAMEEQAASRPAAAAPAESVPPETQDAGEAAISPEAYRKFKLGHYAVSPEEVVRAAGEIFSLADVDYDIAYGRGALLASRTTTLTGYGTGTWYVQATPNGAGTDVVVRFGPGEEVNMPGEDIAGKWRIPQDWIAPSALRPEELESGPALYTVFYKRMDYLLGQNRYWLDCLAAEKYVRMERLGGDLDALCAFCDDVDPGK